MRREFWLGENPRDARIRGGLFALLIALGVGLRLWLAVTDDGIYWPDEIYQSLEPAHRLIFGYGIVAPEFYLGARNWAFPGLCALFMKIASVLGGDAPRHYVPLVRIFFAALSSLAIWGTYRLARTLGAGQTGAALAAIFIALAPPAIYFAPRALSDTVSATSLVWGFALALQVAAPRRLLLGAALVGLSVMFRMQNGLFAVGLLAILAERRRFFDAVCVLIVLALFAFAYAALDRLTWGGWFHSAFAYLHLAEHASNWGVSPPTYYLRIFLTSMPLITVMAFALAAASARAAPMLLATVVVDLLALSLVGHKEFRYVFPFVPMGFALAGVGFSWLLSQRQWLILPLAAAALVSGVGFHRLTFADMGLYEDANPPQSAYDGFGDVNRLLFVAHDQPDLCGLQLVAARMAWSGGATYLHRNVPIYGRDDAGSAGHFNYVITAGNAQGDLVAHEGRVSLVRIGKECTPDPSYNWALR